MQHLYISIKHYNRSYLLWAWCEDDGSTVKTYGATQQRATQLIKVGTRNVGLRVKSVERVQSVPRLLTNRLKTFQPLNVEKARRRAEQMFVQRVGKYHPYSVNKSKKTGSKEIRQAQHTC